jgi:hypothetical protein
MSGQLSSVDLWAAVASALAGGFLALRSNMLKPGFITWADAATPVRLALFLISVVLWGTCLSIVRGALIWGEHANAREAVVYTSLAVSAGVLFWNLHRQTRPRDDTLGDPR